MTQETSQIETTTASACARESCTDCEISGKLLCIHTHRDLADFWVIFLGFAVPFFAGMVLGRHWIGLIIWFGLAFVFFGYLEALILCRHCPHYAEDGFLLKCHANWGLPKIPKLNPTPLNRIEKAAWLACVAVLFLWYVPYFLAAEQWLLLVLTTWAGFTAAWSLQHNQCARCYNLSCPVNRVPEDVREAFFRNYPSFAQAWGVSQQGWGATEE